MAVPVYEQMHRFLLAEIDGGRLRPGARMPSEKELAARSHAIRITFNKALDKLAHEGVIERACGRGSFVASHIGAIHESGARIQQSDGGRANRWSAFCCRISARPSAPSCGAPSKLRCGITTCDW